MANASAQVKILFDATKAETAGSADWVIDADQHNLGYSTGPAVVGGGTESNAQRIPTAAQSGITASTPETYWDGALSAWGTDMVKKGYIVESLPYNGAITYGNTGNPQDLSNYKVFIVCEPNILFTAAEKTAIMNFVKNGGGLFMISDHDVSDRNNDGQDSPHIWNDLMQNNSVQNNPFGITFDYVNISLTSTVVAANPQDSLLHGPGGNVTEVQWSNGTTMSLNTSQNASVTGDVFKNLPASGTTNVMVAHARYFSGKVAAIGDSSPCDDGTGDPNDALYGGYYTDAAGNHEKLLVNTTIWLARTGSATSVNEAAAGAAGISVFPNPACSVMNVRSEEPLLLIEIYNDLGQLMLSSENTAKVDISSLCPGYFVVKAYTAEKTGVSKLVKTE
ncbi:MAG: T9SS type A sorting domain-containing protein [Bacteroidia bacterium]